MIEGHEILLPYVLLFNGFGRENRCTQAFKTKEGIFIRCGCWSGFIESFREKITDTHKDTKFAKEYLMMCDLIELRYAEEKGGGGCE